MSAQLPIDIPGHQAEALKRPHFELQKRVRPDPEGWTAKDYINYGRR